MSAANATKREPLSRSLVVERAIALADDEGLSALTMRNLADQLGYKVMALYNHVANKDELMGLMADAVAEEIEIPAGLPHLEAVRAMTISNRAVFVRHRWACELWQQQFPGPARTGHMEELLRILHESGLPPDLAHHGFHAVNNHVVGYTLQELGMGALHKGDLSGKAKEFLDNVPTDSHPYTVAHVHQHLNGETASSFELVLDLILDGLAALGEQRK